MSSSSLLMRLLLLLLPLLCGVGYTYLNRTIKTGRMIKIQLDTYVPFLPVFVVPYVLWLPFLLFGFLYAFTLPFADFARFAVSFVLGQAACLLVFYFFPTYMEVFKIPGTSFFEKIVNTIYAHDKRFNSLPSLHVTLSVICGYFYITWFPALTSLIVLFVILVCISTVTIKQHYLMDIPTGIAAGLLSVALGQALI